MLEQCMLPDCSKSLPAGLSQCQAACSRIMGEMMECMGPGKAANCAFRRIYILVDVKELDRVVRHNLWAMHICTCSLTVV